MKNNLVSSAPAFFKTPIWSGKKFRMTPSNGPNLVLAGISFFVYTSKSGKMKEVTKCRFLRNDPSLNLPNFKLSNIAK